MTAPFPILPYYIDPQLSLGSSDTWLDHRHPYWQKNVIKWRYARDVYTGEVLDPEKLRDYLIKKGTGESEQAFNERCALADFTSHFGLCADALAGMLFHVESDATRVFGDLGSEDDPATVIGKLYRDADGKKTGYATLWKQLGIELVITHRHWQMVDVVNGAPRVLLFEPERVVDWIEDESGYAMVRLCEEVETRTSLQEKPGSVKQYLVITREGWQRYRETTDTQGKKTAEPYGPKGTHHYEDAAGQLQLPIFSVDLPLRRNIGYPLAKKNVAIFNKEAERDHLLRTANFPKLIVPALDEVFKAIQGQVAAGSFLLQDDPSSAKTIAFAGPPTASVEIATRVIEQKVEQFYKTFFREYQNHANEKTATEIRQDVASGVGAFLQMLKAGLDDAENETLWRLEQVVFPNDRSHWFKARVERSDNFQPLNLDEVIDRWKTRYFGQTQPVPISRDARIEVMRQIAAWDGVPFDEKAVGEEVDNYELMETLDLLDKRQLPVPAAARAKLSIRWLKRLGVVDAKDEAAFTVEAERLAAEEDQAASLLAQPAGPPPAQSGDTSPAKKPDVTNVEPTGTGGYRITKGG